MADDDKLQPGDDPWAGLESEALPDLAGDFSFSFEEQPAADVPGDGTGDTGGEPADAFAPLAESDEAGNDSGADFGEDAESADIDAWLEEPSGSQSVGAEDGAGPGLSVFQHEDSQIEIEDADRSPEAADDDEAANLLAEQSAVEIGTGLSGIPTPSAVGDFGDHFGGGSDPAAVSGSDAPEDAESAADDPFTFAAGEDGGDVEPGLPAAITAGAAATATSRSAKAPRRAAPRRKKPSMVGQLVGVVLGGAMSIPIVLGILWWGVGKDPLQVAPRVPESLGFLVPAKFKPGAAALAASGAGRAPSLDDVLGAGGRTGPVATDPIEPDALPEPDPVPAEPAVTAVADADPAVPADPGPGDEDPLMALLSGREKQAAVAEPPAPPPVPEPEPLDIAGLERTASAASAALRAVVAVADPTDPTFKSVAVKWYRALAAHAEELALLERVAADTGRPLEALPAPAAAVHRDVVAHPELFEPLARLTRDWLAFSKRGSDGVVAPATFVSARRVGPYWRAEVRVGDRPLTVLSRVEPAAAPGGIVIVTGLAIDADTLWASDLQAAEEASPFGL